MPMERSLQSDVCDGSAVPRLREASKHKQRSSFWYRANRSQRVISMKAPLVSVQVRTAALDASSAKRHMWDSSPRGDPIGLAGRRLSRSAKVSSGGHQCPMECTLQVDACDGSAVPRLREASKQKQRSSSWYRASRSQRVISMMAPLVSVHVRTAALDALSAKRHLWDLSPRGETPST